MITRLDLTTWAKVQKAIGDEARRLSHARANCEITPELRKEALDNIRARISVKIDDETGFEEFWRSFPKGRKQGKAGVRRLFLQIIKGKHTDLKANAHELILGAMRYAAVMGDNHPYVVMPARWLREGRWLDEDMGFSNLAPQAQSSVMAAFDDLLSDIKGRHNEQ